MKIALISDGSSIHTIRWANGLSGEGHEVHVVTQHLVVDPLDPAVAVHQFPYRGVLGYFTMVPKIRRLFRAINPDVVNAHYASGYGTTARIVNFHPWLLSVWGSDVYDFPNQSPLHRWLVGKNLRAADKVASTSYCMADETRTLAPELMDIAITPFGVDAAQFAIDDPRGDVAYSDIVIGTVKTMAPNYGISTLICAFAILRRNLLSSNPSIAEKLQLRLVGDGSQTHELRHLAHELGIAHVTEFVGRVPHSEVPLELSKLDIYVSLSERESFGVAIIEAGAAGRPVVVSDVGGLPEVTLDGVTGFVVPRNNPEAAADAIHRLVLDEGLRKQMGEAGRDHVVTNYAWSACVDQMVSVYKSVIAEKIKPASR